MASDSRKKGLGIGLNDLFGITEGAYSAGDKSAVMIRLSDIEPNRSQPRRRFDEESLGALAKSIEQNGVITPVTLRPLPDGKYKLIAGERRWRASRLAGLTEIPALVLDVGEQKAMELALVENLQREDLDPVEVARGYDTLVKAYGMTQEDVAKAVGRSRPAVANALRLLGLRQDMLDMLASGELSEGHARVLLSVPDDDARRALADRIVAEGLNVRQCEAIAKQLASERPKPPRDSESEKLREMAARHTSELSQHLSESWQRKINIKPRATGVRGRIEIEYFDYDDLDEIASALDAIRAAHSSQNGGEELPNG